MITFPGLLPFHSLPASEAVTDFIQIASPKSPAVGSRAFWRQREPRVCDAGVKDVTLGLML